MEEIKWFLLGLPPINLYTANLLQPYYNGVEDVRSSERGVIQPSLLRTDKVDRRAKSIVDLHNAKKHCIKQCKLNKLTSTCIGCNHTIEEIIEA